MYATVYGRTSTAVHKLHTPPSPPSSSIQVDDDVDLDLLASLTEGYSGADVAIVCRDAAMMSVRRVMKGAMDKGLSGPDIQKHVMEMKDELAAAVTMEDFHSSLSKVRLTHGQSPGNQRGVAGREGGGIYSFHAW